MTAHSDHGGGGILVEARGTNQKLMRTLGTIALCVVVLIVGLVVGYKTMFPTYSYRYRLTVAVEIDGQVHKGSSAIEVIWTGQPYIPGAGSYFPHIAGQAAFVDLGSRGAIVAALRSGEASQDPRDGSTGAIWLVPRAFGVSDGDEGLQRLTRLTGRRNLASDNMPRMIWFSDVADLKTARKFKPEEISALFGSGARLAGAHVEITRDPIVIDIDKRLPWYETLKRLRDGVIQIQYGFALTRTMFIGEAS
jgi:hypothetical protein